MLEFPVTLIDNNEDLNHAAEENITSSIIEYIENLLRHTCLAADIPYSEEILTADLDSCDFLDDMIMPDSYTRTEKIRILAGLYALLRDDEKHIPTLEMEYALADVITAMIDIEETGLYLYTRRFKPELRDKMKQHLINDITMHFSDMKQIVLENYLIKNPEKAWEKTIRSKAEEYIVSLESPCVRWIENFCFPDDDYTILEDSVSHRTGSDDYILPDKWLSETGFRYKDEL